MLFHSLFALISAKLHNISDFRAIFLNYFVILHQENLFLAYEEVICPSDMDFDNIIRAWCWRSFLCHQ
jgi:hypothetical protein